MTIHKFIVSLLISLIVSSCGMKSVDGLKNNYDMNSKQIAELVEYFGKLVPPNYRVRIRFDSASDLSLFVSELTGESEYYESIFGQRHVDLDNYVEAKEREQKQAICENQKNRNSLEIVNEKLKWNRETFTGIYEKLNAANCTGIASGRELVYINYGFMGMGELSYMVFDHDLSLGEQEEYSNDCSRMYYKDNIVLTFASGATGSFCISQFNRKK